MEFFHNGGNVNFFRKVVDLLFEFGESVVPLFELGNVFLWTFHSIFEVHIAHELLDNFLNKIAILSAIDFWFWFLLFISCELLS